MTESATSLPIGLAHLIHEVKNPVQIASFAAKRMEMALRNSISGESTTINRLVQDLNDALNNLVSLTWSLHADLEMLSQSRLVIEDVNLHLLIDSILQCEAPLFERRGIKVVKELDVDLPPIKANEKLLRAVLLNLCRNATEAMAKGGILTIKARASMRSIHLDVTDSGQGIPKDVDVFQPFTTSKPNGLGLGLAIARHIIDCHHGTITYSSRSGTGTTFSLKLPAKSGRTRRVQSIERKHLSPEPLYAHLFHVTYD